VTLSLDGKLVADGTLRLWKKLFLEASSAAESIDNVFTSLD
jgi:hypothetical protein